MRLTAARNQTKTVSCTAQFSNTLILIINYYDCCVLLAPPRKLERFCKAHYRRTEGKYSYDLNSGTYHVTLANRS